MSNDSFRGYHEDVYEPPPPCVECDAVERPNENFPRCASCDRTYCDGAYCIGLHMCERCEKLLCGECAHVGTDDDTYCEGCL